jgi:RimJ/RimL family protein N-acetyltransferase
LSLVYPLQTARLSLRPFAPGDLDDILAYRSREDVARYLYGPAVDRAGAEALLQRWIAAASMSKEGERIVWAVTLRDQSPVIGEVTLMWRSQEHRQAEIGYVLNPAYQGHGYAVEAAAPLLRLGFTEFGFHRIYARCDARNTASYKVMERLGMRCEGHFIENELFKGEWSDELQYALLQSEWAKTQPKE